MPSDKYNVTQIDHQIEVNLCGRSEIDEAGICSIIDEINILGSSANLNSVLVNVNQAILKVSLGKICDCIDQFQKLGGYKYRIAILHSSAIDMSAIDFVETAAVNRSIKMRCFKNKNAAMAWLQV